RNAAGIEVCDDEIRSAAAREIARGDRRRARSYVVIRALKRAASGRVLQEHGGTAGEVLARVFDDARRQGEIGKAIAVQIRDDDRGRNSERVVIVVAPAYPVTSSQRYRHRSHYEDSRPTEACRHARFSLRHRNCRGSNAAREVSLTSRGRALPKNTGAGR